MGWALSDVNAVRVGLSYVVLGGLVLPTTAASQGAEYAPVELRQIDPDELVAELKSQGADARVIDTFAKASKGKASARRFLTKEELRSRRYAEVMDHAAALQEGELLEILVNLSPLPQFTEVNSLRTMSERARDDTIQRRRELVADAQKGFSEYAKSVGAVVGLSLITKNSVKVSVPRNAVPQILDHSEVQDVFPDWYEVKPNWNLQEFRDETYLQEFHDAGYQGANGARAGTSNLDDSIRIAIVEARLSQQGLTTTGPNTINGSHLNWLGAGSPTTRISGTPQVCGVQQNVPVCFDDPNATNDLATHGTAVASIAAGGGVAFGTARAGVLPRSLIKYFRTDDPSGIGKALEEAMLWGADVVNLSVGLGCGLRGPFILPSGDPDPDADNGNNCDIQLDCGDLPPLLGTVMDAGVVVVWAAGNRQTDPQLINLKVPQNLQCNVDFPAWRPEVVSVGAAGDKADNPSSFFSANLGSYSSRGLIEAGRGGRYPDNLDMATVSIVGPGVVEGYMAERSTRFQDTSTDPTWSNRVDGTSFSAPAIAGAAGLFREWMSDNAPSKKDDVRHMRAMITAMGNGFGARTSFGAIRSGVGEDWGAGRFFAHPVDALPGGGFDQSAGWVIEGFTSTVSYLPTLTSSHKVLKIGAYIDIGGFTGVRDLTQVPHVLLMVKDACNGMQLLGHDFNFGVEKYVRIETSPPIAGICPVIEYYGLSVGPVPIVYTFAYWTTDADYDVEH